MISTNLLTPREASVILGCTYSSVLALESRGLIKKITIGAHFYYVEHQVNLYIGKNIGKILGFE